LIGPDNVPSTVRIKQDSTVGDVAATRYDLFWQNTKRDVTIVDPYATTVVDGDTVTVEDAMMRE
jgi:hypothetical protein